MCSFLFLSCVAVFWFNVNGQAPVDNFTVRVVYRDASKSNNSVRRLSSLFSEESILPKDESGERKFEPVEQRNGPKNKNSTPKRSASMFERGGRTADPEIVRKIKFRRQLQNYSTRRSSELIRAEFSGNTVNTSDLKLTTDPFGVHKIIKNRVVPNSQNQSTANNTHSSIDNLTGRVVYRDASKSNNSVRRLSSLFSEENKFEERKLEPVKLRDGPRNKNSTVKRSASMFERAKQWENGANTSDARIPSSPAGISDYSTRLRMRPASSYEPVAQESKWTQILSNLMGNDKSATKRLSATVASVLNSDNVEDDFQRLYKIGAGVDDVHKGAALVASILDTGNVEDDFERVYNIGPEVDDVEKEFEKLVQRSDSTSIVSDHRADKKANIQA